MANWNDRPSWNELNNIMLEQATRKIGLTAEQFNMVMHNLQYLKNNLGLSNVEIGTITVTYAAAGSDFDVDITHREVIYGDGISTVGSYEAGDTIDFLDFEFTVASPQIEAEASASLAEDASTPPSVTVTTTPLQNNKGHTFSFSFTIPKGLTGSKGISFRDKGSFDNTLSYVNNDEYIDCVEYEGSYYCPKIATTTIGTIPTDTTEWNLIVHKGDTGNGISSISKTGTSGLVDTYTITFTSGTTTTFTVTNGAEQDITGKADKVSSPTANNFAALDANGNLIDSGKSANSFLTQHQDISGKENSSNKVESINSQSTHTQYPSAKCVYDLVGNIDALLINLDSGSGV